MKENQLSKMQRMQQDEQKNRCPGPIQVHVALRQWNGAENETRAIEIETEETERNCECFRLLCVPWHSNGLAKVTATITAPLPIIIAAFMKIIETYWTREKKLNAELEKRIIIGSRVRPTILLNFGY